MSKKLKQAKISSASTGTDATGEGNNGKCVYSTSSAKSPPELIPINNYKGDVGSQQNKTVIKATPNSGMINVPAAATNKDVNNSLLNSTKKSLRGIKASTSPYTLMRPTETFKDIGGCRKAIKNIFDAASRRLFPDSYLVSA